MSSVGSNEKNSSDINTTDGDFLFADTDLQALFDNDFELQNVPLQMFQVTPFSKLFRPYGRFGLS
jgi:hypothetical protein